MDTEDKLKPQISTSPVPQTLTKRLFSFPEAMAEVIAGRRITRTFWNNDHYCLLKDGKLCIYREGNFRQWLINDGDMLSEDWIVIESN